MLMEHLLSAAVGSQARFTAHRGKSGAALPSQMGGLHGGVWRLSKQTGHREPGLWLAQAFIAFNSALPANTVALQLSRTPF